MTLQELNLRYRTALTDYLGLAGQLEQAKLLQAGDEYHARSAARQRPPGSNRSGERRHARSGVDGR